MLPIPISNTNNPVCAGAITFNVAWLTSSAVVIKHPFQSPVHLYECLLDFIGTVDGTLHKSRPAGGWTPRSHMHDLRTPLVSCHLTTTPIDTQVVPRFKVTVLLFIKSYEVEDFVKRMKKFHLMLEWPTEYNSSHHYNINLIDLRALTTPNWKAASSGIHLLSSEEAAHLERIPCGSDLEPADPSDLLMSELRPHQKQGLAFLLDREKPY
ncbi:hypothetical protein DFH28DRAFT_888649, partial [Melampsora americana]